MIYQFSGLIRKCALLKNVVVPNYYDMCPRSGTSFFYLSNNVFCLLVSSPDNPVRVDISFRPTTVMTVFARSLYYDDGGRRE